MNAPKLSIIIISYNVCELLDQCLASVQATQEGLSLEIIVVDNKSQDQTLTVIPQKYPEIRYIFNEENLGFAKANNQALAIARGEYVLLLNPDTIVLSGALKTMIERLDALSDCAVVGAKLLNPDRSLQPSCRSFPNLINTIVYSFLGYRWLPQLSNPPSKLLEIWSHDREMRVDYLIGAAFMIKGTVLDKIGYLDENFFFYGEEKDWCYRATLAGYKIYFCPNALVIHFGGQSSQQVSLFALKELYKNYELFLNKHYAPVYALVLIIILRTGLLTKAAIFRALSVVKLKQRQNLRQKAAAHFTVFKQQVLGEVK